MPRSSSVGLYVVATPVRIGGGMHFKLSELAARVLMAVIFLAAGLGKLGDFAHIAGFMSAFSVLGALLPIVIAMELLGAAALMLGWQTRLAASLLAGCSLLAAVIFHRNMNDPMEAVMFLRDLCIASGMLLLAVRGAGPLSLDRRSGRDRRSLLHRR